MFPLQTGLFSYGNLIQVLRKPDTQDCEIFLLLTGFCYAQLPLAKDFCVLLVITPATNEVLLTASIGWY